MALFYLLFAKFVPIISIWELKAGTHGASAVPSPLPARTRPLPRTAGPMTADAGLGATDD